MVFNLLRRVKNRLKLLEYKFVLNQANDYENRGTCWNTVIKINGNNNKIRISSGCSLRDVSIILNGDNHNLVLKEDVNIKSGLLWFEGRGNLLEINKKTTIEEATIAVLEEKKKILIGQDCMLSDKIVIRNGDSHSIIDELSGRRLNPAGDIIIKDHVWIGSNVTILKNIIIEENSIVGINSLVTKSIKANSIVAGSPAKEIKRNINWKRELI